MHNDENKSDHEKYGHLLVPKTLDDLREALRKRGEQRAWGNWVLGDDDKHFYNRHFTFYCVEFYRIKTCREVVEWMIHLRDKEEADPRWDIGGLMAAIVDVAPPDDAYEHDVVPREK